MGDTWMNFLGALMPMVQANFSAFQPNDGMQFAGVIPVFAMAPPTAPVEPTPIRPYSDVGFTRPQIHVKGKFKTHRLEPSSSAVSTTARNHKSRPIGYQPESDSDSDCWDVKHYGPSKETHKDSKQAKPETTEEPAGKPPSRPPINFTGSKLHDNLKQVSSPPIKHKTHDEKLPVSTTLDVVLSANEPQSNGASTTSPSSAPPIAQAAVEQFEVSDPFDYEDDEPSSSSYAQDDDDDGAFHGWTSESATKPQTEAHPQQPLPKRPPAAPKIQVSAPMSHPQRTSQKKKYEPMLADPGWIKVPAFPSDKVVDIGTVEVRFGYPECTEDMLDFENIHLRRVVRSDGPEPFARVKAGHRWM